MEGYRRGGLFVGVNKLAIFPLCTKIVSLLISFLPWLLEAFLPMWFYQGMQLSSDLGPSHFLFSYVYN